MTANPDWLAVSHFPQSPIIPKNLPISRVSDVLSYFPGIFESSNNCKLGTMHGVEHCIDLLDSNKVISQPMRRIPLAYSGKVEELVQDMKANGIVRDSLSPYNSPIVVVPKKDGQIRLCVDYRNLNANTKKPSFYIPDVQEILERVAGNTMFSTLDLVKGYHQIKMSVDSIEKKQPFLHHLDTMNICECLSGSMVPQRLFKELCSPY